MLANPLVDVVDTDQANAVTVAARWRDTVLVSPLLDDVDDEAAAVIEDLLATLETLRTGEIKDATETLRRMLDDWFDLEAATEDYASGAEQAIEQRAYDRVDEVLSSFEKVFLVGLTSEHLPVTPEQPGPFSRR